MSFDLAVCSEMVFTELDIVERAKRIDDLGFQVEIWSFHDKDLDALAATGATFSSMTGYLHGDLYDPEGADEVVRQLGRWAICSNKHTISGREELARLGWAPEQAWFSSDFGGAAKRLAPVIEAMGLDATDVAYVGDTEHDQACAEGIKAQKLSRFAESGTEAEVKKLVADDMVNYADAIAQGVGDLTNWLVYDDRAEVYFAPYALGSYAEGEYQCTLPKADLEKAAGSKGWIVP